MVNNFNPKKEKKGGKNVVFGREVVDMSIKVIPEVKAKIEAFAKQQNIDAAAAGGVIMEFAIAKHEALAEVAKEKVREIFTEEVGRFEHALETLISPDDFKNIKKRKQIN